MRERCVVCMLLNSKKSKGMGFTIMENWLKSEKCLDKDALADLFQNRVSTNNKNLVKYIIATAVVCIALEFLVPNIALIAVAIVFIIGMSVVMAFKNRGYKSLMEEIRSGNFTWTTGRLQSKYKRALLDISSQTPPYSIMILNEWYAADISTFIDCEIGEKVIIVKKGDTCFGLPVPGHVSCKNGTFRLKAA